MKKVVVCVSALVALSLAAMAQANKNPWAKFNPGSWQKTKITTEMNMAGNVNKTQMETKMTLLAKTADKVTVESETTVMGRPTKTKVDIPMSAGVTGTSKPVASPKIGSETITVAGKTFKCMTAEFQTDTNGVKATVKSWTAEEVPGGLVKMVTVTSGQMSMKSTMELVDFKAM